MPRTLTFEQIVDSRFNEDMTDLKQRHTNLMELLNNQESLTVKHGQIYEVDFTNTSENNMQYRIEYWIEKRGRKLTWNDVYSIVNSVKAVPYKFI